MDIFISYSRKDRERVDFMAKALEAEGYSVWWDRDLRAGEEFDNVIDQHIKESKAIVVVWSQTSINSNWVKEEAEDGVLDNKLVPAMIDFVTIPRGFRRIQAAELHDAKENPTASENWSEFLDSVRKLAGEGQGAKAGADEIAALRAANTEGSPPLQSPEASTAKPFWKSPIAIAAATLGAVMLGVLALQFGGFGSSDNGRLAGVPEDQAVVLGIYPSEGFGIQQSNGLKASFDGFPKLMVKDLDAPLDAMKTRKAPGVLKDLELFLEKRNVVAIVGPSITEFTPQVLKVVEESGKRPAIVLTTAGSRADIGWQGSTLPIFRVGSGVDERAKQFKKLAGQAIAQGIGITFLIESVGDPNAKTYGELFYDQVAGALGQEELAGWMEDGTITTRTFTKGQIDAAFATPEDRAVFDQDRLIVIMGLSSDFKDLAQSHFRADQPARKALLAGWNNSHQVQALSEATALQTGRLIDMTDVFKTTIMADEKPYYMALFEEAFKPVSPRWRLEAVAFDSGLIVREAANGIDGEITPEAIIAQLKARRFRGVTGQIFFNSTGQNTGDAGGQVDFYNVSYDPSSNGWREVGNLGSLMQ